MKPNLYICHTAYQVLVDLLRAGRCAGKPHTMVLSASVPDTAALAARLDATGIRFSESRTSWQSIRVYAVQKKATDFWQTGIRWYRHWSMQRRKTAGFVCATVRETSLEFTSGMKKETGIFLLRCFRRHDGILKD